MQWCLPLRRGETSPDVYHARAPAPLHDFAFGGGALLHPPNKVEIEMGVSDGGGDGAFYRAEGADGWTDKVVVAVVINPRSAGAAKALKRLKHLPEGVRVFMLERDTRRLMEAMTDLLTSARTNGGGVRVIAGGGDGTVASVACLMADACQRAGLNPSSAVAPVAPLPLGTVGLRRTRATAFPLFASTSSHARIKKHR